MKSAIERQAREFEPDIIYFNTLRSAHWRCALPDGAAARVIDLDEFRSDYYRQISETARNLIWRWVARTESARMRSEEAQIIQDFRSVMVSSPTDVHMAANVTLVRSPHALKQAREAPPRSAHPSIVFVGRMSYGANIDAIRWFCRHAFPAIQQAIPDVTLDIVGDAPSRKVKALESDSIRVRGRVESVDEHYQSAWVSIVPVTSATGVQMKLIESLDLGTPVVTTPLVAAQAGVRDGVEVVIASDPRDWSTRVVDLLRSETNRHRLSARGQEWANDHYSMSRIRRDLNSAVLSARQA